MSNIIEISNLNYENIFKNLSFNVEKNKFITISGANNCGKTTLIKILSKNLKYEGYIDIANYNIKEMNRDTHAKLVQCIFPKEIIFLEKTLKEELDYLIDKIEEEKEKYINYIVSNLKIKSLLTKPVNSLTDKEIILSQIAIALVNEPEVLLLDDISTFFNKKELDGIFTFLNKIKEERKLTILLATIDLNLALYSDYLYILDDGKIALEGEPLNVLQKDNIINKIGLPLPFMIDLSVKLRDYDLVEDIELELDRMVDKLWK